MWFSGWLFLFAFFRRGRHRRRAQVKERFGEVRVSIGLRSCWCLCVAVGSARLLNAGTNRLSVEQIEKSSQLISQRTPAICNNNNSWISPPWISPPGKPLEGVFRSYFHVSFEGQTSKSRLCFFLDRLPDYFDRRSAVNPAAGSIGLSGVPSDPEVQIAITISQQNDPGSGKRRGLCLETTWEERRRRSGQDETVRRISDEGPLHPLSKSLVS